ncbi:MAG: T9SS type A sorting domain-containing protein [Roseivirga sp.]|uniref:type IX secretion system anionic LPS delivery protein PorZ n=1 Tax=Roseivirga sp. TaxID=1964215 RepID=UPI001B0C52A5|nr:T9SS type A sorting domain-containing protein [Roseivirga sp.]MBO6661020.1 T9SS type A sorting domain-containing protein [Roseivirga sp.]MBO6908996.1 T9SS type A sorting domain-containing protein [Roseivirga sp.]
MRKSSFFTLWVILIVSFQHIKAQNTPVLGWRSNFSYTDVKSIVKGNSSLYAATENTIFAIDRAEGSLSKLTKINGLNDVSVGALGLMPDGATLIIGYQNGNIDFVSDSEIKNLSTVKDFETTQSKRFRSITNNSRDIYFAGDLGVIVYNIDRDEITEAYQNLGQEGKPLSINQVLIYNDSIFAATADGLLAASLASSINRQDFNNWQRSLSGLAFSNIIQTSFGLFAASDSDLFKRENGNWIFYQNLSSPITHLESLGNEVLVSTETQVLNLTESSLESIYNIEGDGTRINDVLNDGSFIWVATDGLSLQRLIKGASETGIYTLDGPTSDLSYNAELFGSKIYLNTSTFSDLNEENSFSLYNHEDRNWLNIKPSITGEPIGQIIDLAELNDEIYLASYDQGLFKTNLAGNSEALISSNSGPVSINGSYNLSSITTDEDGLIWVSFYNRDNSVFSFNPSNNSWENQSPGHPFARYTTDIFIGPNGDKWLSVDPNEGGGIVVYNETSNRERYLNLNGGQGGLSSNVVTDIELDQDFFVWVATSQGIAFFTNPYGILEGGSLTASVPIFENRLLLRNEYITDIGIDPANRKWFGTRSNGIWLFSETGEELIYHFTINNSPLPSNNILSLAIEPVSGEVLITTDKGAISFRSDATIGTDEHQNVKVYPNPVAPSFTGQIVIEGLVNNAQLKITDVSGKLVKEVQANGSTAIWNARDLNNARVKSGVYLVFSSSQDGLETYVAKIVII